MGPRPIRRGSRRRSLGRELQVLASMGPRPIRRGSPAHRPGRVRDLVASMGPRPIRRGSMLRLRRCNPNDVASMGPRAIRRGSRSRRKCLQSLDARGNCERQWRSSRKQTGHVVSIVKEQGQSTARATSACGEFSITRPLAHAHANRTPCDATSYTTVEAGGRNVWRRPSTSK